MYIDRKITYLWYAQVKALCKRFAKEQPTKGPLLKAVIEILNPAQLD